MVAFVFTCTASEFSASRVSPGGGSSAKSVTRSVSTPTLENRLTTPAASSSQTLHVKRFKGYALKYPAHTAPPKIYTLFYNPSNLHTEVTPIYLLYAIFFPRITRRPKKTNINGGKHITGIKRIITAQITPEYVLISYHVSYLLRNLERCQIQDHRLGAVTRSLVNPWNLFITHWV